MGCGQSKNQVGITSVVPRDTGIISSSTPVKNSPAKRKGCRNVDGGSERDGGKTSDLEDERQVPPPEDSRSKKKRISRLVKKDSWVMGSQDSLADVSDGGDSRQGSATSKVSQHSADSGFDDHEYKHVITEHSETHAVKQIEGGFETPRGLELDVVGQGVPQRYSAKDNERMKEQAVIATLREEGLITRPLSRAGGGLSFEVTTERTPPFARDSRGSRPTLPPLQRAKLEKRKKHRRTLTEEDIKAKLEKAEERRKEAEQKRLDKIQSVTMKSNVQSALDSFAEMQKSKVEENLSKVDTATENRERRMNEMRDKLKSKQAHAEKVRLRRQQMPMDMDEKPPVAPSRFSEDAPIRASAEAFD